MSEHSAPYHALAALYDTLMGNVDYDAWADYIDELIQLHGSETKRILEVACGTGSLALSLDELGTYDVTATDLSEAMIRIARKKAALALSPVQFDVADMTDMMSLKHLHEYDAVLCLFDSLNYLLEPSEVSIALQQMHRTLRPGGLLIFDISTEANSRDAEARLNHFEPVQSGEWQFRQESRYLEEERIHQNRFWIEPSDPDKRSGEPWLEEHRQRIYPMEEIEAQIETSPFRLLHKYDNFRLQPATRKSLRITFVCQC
ncbi:MAG: methyltransferase domain-containing protein [Balneolaceae bacterium]